MREETKRYIKRQRCNLLRDVLKNTLGLLFSPFISMIRFFYEGDMDSLIQEEKDGLGGERGVGDGCGAGCALILFESVYLIMLSVAIHFLLKWAFGIYRFWIDVLVFIVLLVLNLIYLSLCQEDIKEIAMGQKQRWRDRNRKR